jgi:thioredoxin reductase
MANREFYDLIIVGGGPGGLSAGIYALRASMRTVLIEKGAPGGQVSLSAEVENYPAIKSRSGFEPNNQLVPAGTRMNADGYVVTDEKCETNIDGIFAIGDLREKYARQIVLSAADGCTAALAAAHYVEIKRAEEGSY